MSWRVVFPTFREIGKCSVEWVPNQTLSQNTPQAALLSIYFHFMFSLQVFHCIQENNGFTRLWKKERNRREREIEREIVREKWRDRQRETQKERLKRERVKWERDGESVRFSRSNCCAITSCQQVKQVPYAMLPTCQGKYTCYSVGVLRNSYYNCSSSSRLLM